MKTVFFFFVSLALMLTCSTVQAQFGKKLGDAVQKSAEKTTVKKAEQKTEKAVSKGIDKATDPNTYKDDGKNANQTQPQQQQAAVPANNGNSSNSSNSGNTGGGNAPAAAPQSSPAQTPQQDIMAWNKFDFVSGDEIMFDDNQAAEKLGEFPSMWDMTKGNIEVANINGENAIALFKVAGITPLMKTPKNYLPEDFTIELDFYQSDESGLKGQYHFYILDGNTTILLIKIWENASNKEISMNFRSTGGENRTISETVEYDKGWNRLSISFNKRALKVYVNEKRVANAPNVAQGKWFSIETYLNTGRETKFFVRNVRIAKGAVPLYDRMMSDGKFITYGITFDVGKSTIKPESMGEINRIVTLMKENPDLKFSVEGHTDSTGSAASNQTLSEARSQAVVQKLVENGIAADRLKAAGKGQNNPIADNGTDEGRAKNRRVEFVKI